MNRREARKKNKKFYSVLSILMISAIFLFVNCEQPFLISDILDGPDGIELTLSPSSAQVVINDTITFQASGGVPPYSYSLLNPIEGTGEDLTDGTYTAPTTTGIADIQVSDSYGAVTTAAVEVISDGGIGPLTISPSAISITGGNSITLVASGGTGAGTYSYELFTPISGSGESFSGNTYVAPTDLGGTATVRVTDGNLDFVEAEIVVTISASSALAISPGAVTLNLSDSIELSASGGEPPYAYTPVDLIGGTLVGSTYTAPSDNTGTAIIRVTDNASTTSDSTITVTPASALAIVPVTLSANTGGSFTFTAYGGVPPYTFTIQTSGSGLPSIDSVTGVYLAGGTTGTDTIRVTDNDEVVEEASVTVTGLTTEVNYDTVTVSNTGGTAGGTLIEGNFTFINNGTGNGSETVSWEVYVSLDTTIGAGDSLIDSNTTSALNSTITSAAIPFTGIWPVPASDISYYLIAKISAIDDLITADNEGFTTPLTVTAPVSANIDYIVQSITNSPATADISTPIEQSFKYENQGSDPGAYTVYWTAYFSEDDVLDGGDTPASSGSVSALGALTSSEPISITNNWPSSAGVYYLIVNISAGDDNDPSNNYFVSNHFTINATGTLIDYKPTNISRDYPTVTSGSLCSETFDLSNIGGGDGADNITWTAWASDNTSLGGDTEIGSGILSPLDAGFGYSSVPISGSWPGTAGDYYIIIDILAPNEDITDNNTAYNGPYTVKDPPDYSISSATIQLDGDPGLVLSTYGVFDFTVHNSGADGSQPIEWEVFTSVDTILDGNDTSIKTGYTQALTSGSDSEAISFADAVWPLMGSYYYLILNINSPDDSSPFNNQFISSLITVPERFTETIDSYGFGTSSGTIPNVSDLDLVLNSNVMDMYELMIIDDVMEGKINYDTYKMTLGTGVTTLSAYAEWSTTLNSIDIYIWDESNGEWTSIEFDADREPGLSTVSFTGLTSGSVYYVAVEFRDNGGSDGRPYKLVIYAKP
ncbi:MAG: hypothetical protein KAH95_02550 [Spirochaetales bacterium]|nr:hypothetical protein [Spirochaetales bacterium]